MESKKLWVAVEKFLSGCPKEIICDEINFYVSTRGNQPNRSKPISSSLSSSGSAAAAGAESVVAAGASSATGAAAANAEGSAR